MSQARHTPMLAALARATVVASTLMGVPACETRETRETPQPAATSSAAPFASFSPLPSSEPVLAPPTGSSDPVAPAEAPSGSSRAAVAKIITGKVTVSGRIAPNVVQAILRQNYGRFRMCYEPGLKRNAALAGTVTARFVIGRDGTVSHVSDGGSSLADTAVHDCILNAVKGLSFPQPEGGIVTVVYPMTLSPG